MAQGLSDQHYMFFFKDTHADQLVTDFGVVHIFIQSRSQL